MKPSRLALLLCAVMFTGCFHIRYVREVRAEETPAYDSWHHSAIWGLVNLSGDINVSQACPQGIAEVENEVTFLNWLASRAVQGAVATPIALATRSAERPTGYVIPIELWSPQTVRVTCAAPVK